MTGTETFKRRVEWTPTYTKGLESGEMRLRFVLIGPLGATHFAMHTGWHLEGRADKPSAWDLGYHWTSAQYPDHHRTDDCEYVSGTCYYDGSGRNAEPVLTRFLAEGDSAVWEVLRSYYDSLSVPQEATL